MNPVVSILTPSIPERSSLLRQCQLSVEAQTLGPENYEHLVIIDHDHRGCSWGMNQLAGAALGEWLLPLADDDLILPNCLEALLEASEDADIVYAPPLVWGNNSRHFYGEPPYIPSFALIYRDLWREIGGYDAEAIREEDRKFWIEAQRLDAKFVKVDWEPTWIYRFHGGNKSYAGGVAS